MNVMESDVSREPLEDFGQLVERTAVEGRFRKIPVGMTLPVDVFKLMLDVKEPYLRTMSFHSPISGVEGDSLPTPVLGGATDCFLLMVFLRME